MKLDTTVAVAVCASDIMPRNETNRMTKHIKNDINNARQYDIGCSTFPSLASRKPGDIHQIIIDNRMVATNKMTQNTGFIRVAPAAIPTFVNVDDS